MNIYILYTMNYLKWGDVCKSLLFLLVNLVTVSLHCSNYIARCHQIHTSCITKDKGVWLRMTGRNKRFWFRFKKRRKVILIFCGEQYWCVVYYHLYDVQYGEYAGTTVVSVTSTYIYTAEVCIYSSQYRLWRQVMTGWMFIKYCLTFHNWIADATPLPWQASITELCDIRRIEIPYLSDQQPY